MKINEIINLTPHEVNIISSKGYTFSYPSEGIVRVSQETERINEINFSGKVAIPISKTKFGECKNLPEEKADTIYIVSALVCQACPERPDFYIPNETVRDEQGRIIGCKSLAKNPYIVEDEK